VGDKKMERHRQIIYFKDYFLDFFEQQTEKVKEKIDYVLFIVTVADRIPQKFFQHLEGTNGLYEIRVEFQGNIYRIFCYFDEGQVVVLFNGFQKKSQKTPSGELDKAVKIMNEYFDEKLKLKQNELAKQITNSNKKNKKL
jgi:phage-related protein